MYTFCPHLSNTSDLYHIPKNIAQTVDQIAKARSYHNGLTWGEFNEKWRRRFSNPYQFFAVS